MAGLGHTEVISCKGDMYASALLEMEAGRIAETTGQKG